jgi:hypothetical protein
VVLFWNGLRAGIFRHALELGQVTRHPGIYPGEGQ